jgi:hypothetical protein
MMEFPCSSFLMQHKKEAMKEWRNKAAKKERNRVSE